ncbi:MAG TPA: quinone oxidoreductase [Bryobacteraceae bacterium]|nr:quinone oxidoreductase [Bryobacteraceae bacterium]
MKAAYIEKTGPPEVLVYGERPIPEPAAGEVLVKIAAAGVNFADINLRSGVSKVPLPAIPGMEAAGTIEKVGDGVADFTPGDRVGYVMVRGSYAEYAAVPAKMLARIPDDTSLETAATAMLQGFTAHYLTQTTYPLKPGLSVLIHAAAGGTGRLLVQLASQAGAHVIATVGSEAKAAIARDAGAAETLLYEQQDWVAEVKRITGGEGVDVVYDSVGKTTFVKGLDCLKPRGMMIHFGVSSGQIEPLNTRALTERGSLYLTRPTLLTHVSSPAEIAWRAGDIFRWIGEGKLKLRVEHEYPLAEAGQAHRDLESRATAGKIILRVK